MTIQNLSDKPEMTTLTGGPQCKLIVDLKQGLYFSDINKNCCKGFDTSPTISKDLRDLTLIETQFARGVLMLGILELFEPLSYSTSSLATNFGLSPDFVIGKLSSYKGCGNGRIENGEDCDDGNLSNLDSCSVLCKNITSGVDTQGNSLDEGEFKFSDPFSGKVFSKDEITSLTKANPSNKRVKLEKAVGDCVFNTICLNNGSFDETTGNVKGPILGNTIDRCLEANRDFLPPIVLENRQTPCNISIDIDERSASSTINKSCCTPLQENNSSGLISKDLRNFSLAETLMSTLIFALISAITLQFVSAAKIRTDRGSAELDLEQQGRQAVELIVNDIRHSGLTVLNNFCDEHPDQCVSGKPSKLNSLDTAEQEELTGVQFGSGVKNILDEETINKISRLPKISSDKLREFRANIEQYLALCTNAVLCSNPDGVFEPNNERIVNKEILSSVIDTCFNFAGFSLPPSSKSIDENLCKLDLDINEGTISGEFNKNCCSIKNDNVLKRANGFIEKELRNIALIFVLFALDVFSILALTYLIDSKVEAKMVAASRDSKLAQYAAEAGLQEVITRLNLQNSDINNNQFTYNVLVEVYDDDDPYAVLFTGLESINEKERNKSAEIPDFNAIDPDNSKIKTAERRLEKIKGRLSKFLAACFDQVLCENKDSLFKDGKLNKQILPGVANVCLNRVGIAYVGKPDAPCICTYKGCFCKPDAICKSQSCVDDPSCKCNDNGECLCPLNKVCENVRCEEEYCYCEDDLCNDNSDCQSGICLPVSESSFCTKTATEDCPEDYSTKKICAPNESCGIDRDCNANEMCDNGTKTCTEMTTCQADDDCDSGRMCSTTKKICVPKSITCQSDNDCRSDQFCGVLKQCVRRCVTDTDCTVGNTCNKTNGRCEKIVQVSTGCTSKSECKSGELCFERKCQLQQSCILPPPGSFAQNPCPLGQFCFFQDKKCWNISCITTADCPPANHVCNKNICEFRP